jgi:hypothetical protein
MGEEFQVQQFFGGFVFPIIFTIPRAGFFVGLFPRPFFFSEGGNQPPMRIQRIQEHEYQFMRRIGITEVSVMTSDYSY